MCGIKRPSLNLWINTQYQGFIHIKKIRTLGVERERALKSDKRIKSFKILML